MTKKNKIIQIIIVHKRLTTYNVFTLIHLCAFLNNCHHLIFRGTVKVCFLVEYKKVDHSTSLGNMEKYNLKNSVVRLLRLENIDQYPRSALGMYFTINYVLIQCIVYK